MHADSVNGEACAMVACMVIQIAVRASISPLRSDLTRSTYFPYNSTRSLRYYHLVDSSTHTKDGRRDALYHPTCRFDPNAPSPIAVLGVHHQSMHRIPQSSYTQTTNASI
jgi:hypothetical protein